MISDTDFAIRERKTTKVLAARDLPCGDSSELLSELLALAGMAPFHRACDETHRTGQPPIDDPQHATSSLKGIEPWRFHVLEASSCRRLRSRLPSENAGKIPSMLAAADALIMATWLPNPPSSQFLQVLEGAPNSDSWPFEPSLANMEHIAAAAAAIENLLLAATARGISNYWSSGGVLRSSDVFELLGIRSCEVLLGALFLFPKSVEGSEVVGSKLRGHRTACDNWTRWIDL